MYVKYTYNYVQLDLLIYKQLKHVHIDKCVQCFLKLLMHSHIILQRFLSNHSITLLDKT